MTRVNVHIHTYIHTPHIKKRNNISAISVALPQSASFGVSVPSVVYLGLGCSRCVPIPTRRPSGVTGPRYDVSTVLGHRCGAPAPGLRRRLPARGAPSLGPSSVACHAGTHALHRYGSQPHGRVLDAGKGQDWNFWHVNGRWSGEQKTLGYLDFCACQGPSRKVYYSLF